MKKFALFIILFLSCSLLQAQDTLMTRGGEARTVKVLEIGLEEIKYRIWGLDDSPVIVIDKNDVKYIVFSNGEKMTIVQDEMAMSTIQQRAAGKRQAIKVEFLGPLTDDLTLCYERVLRPGFNLEGKVGWIGIGVNPEAVDAGGVFVKFGTKFWSGKDYYFRGMKMSHPLRGAYVKPEFIFSQFYQNRSYSVYNPNSIYTTTRTERVNYTNLALNICFGKQVLLSDIMTMDWYIGIGYGWQASDADTGNNTYWLDEEIDWTPYAYSHTYLGRNFPMTLSGGLTIGVLLK